MYCTELHPSYPKLMPDFGSSLFFCCFGTRWIKGGSVCPMALSHQGHWGSIHLSSLVDAVGLWVSFFLDGHVHISQLYITILHVYFFGCVTLGRCFLCVCVFDLASPELIFKTLGGRRWPLSGLIWKPWILKATVSMCKRLFQHILDV